MDLQAVEWGGTDWIDLPEAVVNAVVHRVVP